MLAGVVDAIARGEVGNLMAARARSGLRVTAFDDTGREPVAFSYPATPDGDALRGAVDGVIPLPDRRRRRQFRRVAGE